MTTITTATIDPVLVQFIEAMKQGVNEIDLAVTIAPDGTRTHTISIRPAAPLQPAQTVTLPAPQTRSVRGTTRNMVGSVRGTTRRRREVNLGTGRVVHPYEETNSVGSPPSPCYQPSRPQCCPSRVLGWLFGG